jgi:hypothetical protein
MDADRPRRFLIGSGARGDGIAGNRSAGLSGL